MRFRTLMLTAAFMGVFVMSAAVPADASTTSLGCSSRGFAGSFRVISDNAEGAPRTGVVIDYRIDTGGNQGGSEANVWVNDFGVVPARKLNIGNAIQDGKWHRLYGPYDRRYGAVAYGFVFDRPWLDPWCSAGAGSF